MDDTTTGRVTYRGFTLIQLTLGSWIASGRALTGQPFPTLSDAKRAVDRLLLPHGASL